MKLKHPVVAGHPLHAMASDLPVALIPTALLATIAARARPARETRFASDAASTIAVSAAAAAGALGIWDWLTIPWDHPAKRPATIHGLLNVAGLGAGMVALLRPRRRLELLVGINAALLVAAWIGGDLVYILGWRVRPAEELELLDAGHDRDDVRRIIEEHERADTFFPVQR